MQLLLVRHSTTLWNQQRRYLGRQDLPLTAEGEALARARKAEMPTIDGLWVSPLLRCIQTAALLFPDTEQHLVRELQECDFGRYEGSTWEELKDKPFYHAWLAGEPEAAFPGGERQQDFLNRCAGAVKRIVEEAWDTGLHRPAILAHGGTLMAAMSAFAVPHKDIHQWMPENCGGFLVSVSRPPMSFTLLEQI